MNTKHIYYEKQNGDLCRLHSINAYFGFQKLKITDFNNLCDEYDSIIKGLVSKNMDGFAEGRSIVSYILDKLDKKYIMLIPINSYLNSRVHLNLNYYEKIIKLVDYFFEFNKNHIWFNKKINNIWYKIDSITGVNIINEPNITNNGFFLILDKSLLFNEICYYINCLKKINKEDEIVIYNLYHSLKHVNLHCFIKNDRKFNLNLLILQNIFKYTTNYVLLKRQNKNDNLDNNIKNIIKYIQLIIIK